MHRLLMQRQYTLFRTQSDFCATSVMFAQYLSEYLFQIYRFSSVLTESQRLDRVIQFAVIGVAQVVGLVISQKVIKWKQERDRKKQGVGLPEGKSFHVFLSHKKERMHSEGLAVALKDALKVKGYQSFFDKDNLDQISQEVLDRSIRESCCLLVVLDDVTLNSEWCRAEIKTAAAAGIPIRCVVDSDKYITADLCKQWFSSEHADVAALIFSNQIVDWKTAFRQHTIERLTTILDNIVDSMWKEELQLLKAQQSGAAAPEESTVESGDESALPLSSAKHSSRHLSSATLTMEEEINQHLNQTPGLLEAMQQKENVFWFTLGSCVFCVTMCNSYLRSYGH